MTSTGSSLSTKMTKYVKYESVDFKKRKQQIKKPKSKLLTSSINSFLQYKNIKALTHSGDEKMAKINENGFLNMLLTAYSEHYPVSIYPDDIKLLIQQALSKYVNDHTEELRDIFVNHSDKKELKVVTGDIKLSQDYWYMVTNKFAIEINKNINDEHLIDFSLDKYSTTQINNAIVSKIAIMDTFKEYFSYRLITLCGIPEYRFHGTPDDWRSLLEFAKYIEKYMSKYSNKMQLFISHILMCFDESKNTSVDNIDYWDNFIKLTSVGSGSDKITGHVMHLFHYFEYDHIKKYNNEIDKITSITSNDVKTGISTVDFIWEDQFTNITKDMILYAGFGGFVLDENEQGEKDALKTSHVWVVAFKNEDNQNNDNYF